MSEPAAQVLGCAVFFTTIAAIILWVLKGLGVI
jgi:hypothetical protein